MKKKEEGMKGKIVIRVVVMLTVFLIAVIPAPAEEINLVGTENGESVFEAVAEAFEK